jgi:hypothetical protein
MQQQSNEPTSDRTSALYVSSCRPVTVRGNYYKPYTLAGRHSCYVSLYSQIVIPLLLGNWAA